MLIEWDAHTDYYNNTTLSTAIDNTFGFDTRTQAKHVNFDRDSEGLSRWGYYIKASKGYIIKWLEGLK